LSNIFGYNLISKKVQKSKKKCSILEFDVFGYYLISKKVRKKQKNVAFLSNVFGFKKTRDNRVTTSN